MHCWALGLGASSDTASPSRVSRIAERERGLFEAPHFTQTENLVPCLSSRGTKAPRPAENRTLSMSLQ